MSPTVNGTGHKPKNSTRSSGRKTSIFKKGLGVLIAAGIAASLLASFAVASNDKRKSRIDTAAVAVIGAPLGIAPQPRVDPLRHGSTRTALPKVPRELWRRELSGLTVPPVVDGLGGVIAALSTPEVVRIDSKASQSWHAELGSASAIASPAILSNGSIALLCDDGMLWLLDRNGVVVHKTALPIGTLTAGHLHAREDGSVLIAADQHLLEVGPWGQIWAHAVIPESIVGGVIPWLTPPQGPNPARDRGALVTTHQGTIFNWRPPQQAVKLGSFNGLPNGGALLAGRNLIAVIEGKRVSSFDLHRGVVSELLGGVALGAFEGPPTFSANGVLLVSTVLGELLGVDGHRQLVRQDGFRTLPAHLFADAGRRRRPAAVAASPPFIVDPYGNIGFVRASGRVGVMSALGRVRDTKTQACSNPLAVLPAGDQRMLVACQNGALLMYGVR